MRMKEEEEEEETKEEKWMKGTRWRGGGVGAGWFGGVVKEESVEGRVRVGWGNV
jgi:hypothetical protein